VCWFCGHSLAALTLPVSHFDTCKACGVALHACRQCEFYAEGVANQCREPMAEKERDKQRANHCDYFSPHQGAFEAKLKVSDAHVQLAALFGDSPTASTAHSKVTDHIKQRADAAAQAKAALDALFKTKQ
jgi:hypothetical protein